MKAEFETKNKKNGEPKLAVLLFVDSCR